VGLKDWKQKYFQVMKLRKLGINWTELDIFVGMRYSEYWEDFRPKKYDTMGEV